MQQSTFTLNPPSSLHNDSPFAPFFWGGVQNSLRLGKNVVTRFIRVSNKTNKHVIKLELDVKRKDSPLH